MSWSAAPWLSLLTLTPAVGGLVVLLAPLSPRRAAAFSKAVAALTLLGTLGVLAGFDRGAAGFQLVEQRAWAPQLGMTYFLGVDGLSVLLLPLAAGLTLWALALSGRWLKESRAYGALILLLEAGLMGSFTALNFFHWFLFWELSLAPAFFLIKLWGEGDRHGAAAQFFLYTMAGSVAMLVAFLALFGAAGSFDFPSLAEAARKGGWAPLLERGLRLPAGAGPAAAMALCLAVWLGFAVKIPIAPFHTWLPAAYVAAPTPVTILLTGAMSKMGVYGLARVWLGVFPVEAAQAAPWLLVVAVFSVVISAAAAAAQKDMKRMFAYSSVNHLGYCALALTAVAAASGRAGAEVSRQAAWSGFILQMVNHGITAGALFGFLALFEARTGCRRGLDEFGGLRRAAPVFCGLMGISAFASMGLPGLNGFVGEFLIFRGVFGLAPWAAAVSLTGLLLTAVFLLTMMQRVFHGPLRAEWRGFSDLSARERLAMAPAIAAMFALGLWPNLALMWCNQTVARLAEGAEKILTSML